MADDTTTTPAEPEVKMGKKYSYAAMVLNENFAEITQNLHHPMKTNPFAKTLGIPTLEYFDEMTTGVTENCKRFQHFLKDCESSLDVITHFPAPASTIGSEPFDVPFKEIPAAVTHIKNIYAALQYFRGLAGYVAEVKPQTVKNISMESLAEVEEKGVKSNR